MTDIAGTEPADAPVAEARTTIIDAAVPAALLGSFDEAVQSGDLTTVQDDPDGAYRALTAVDQAVFMATMGRAVAAIKESQHHPDVFSCPDDPVGATLLTVLEETASDYATVTKGPANSDEVKFAGITDPLGWASAAWPQFKQKHHIGRVAFAAGPHEPTPIPDNSRVVILGDWGTNLYGAPFCAQSIQGDPEKPDVLIHLGDVYYTGTERQINERFLVPWPWIKGAVNRACNSNHEMLSGGGPFMRLTLPRFDQSSSLWWLQNSQFDLIGLDTGWDDGKVGQMQLAWLKQIVTDARAAGRKTIAFSHHMAWGAAHPEIKHELVDLIADILDARELDGWYWGHEHLCSVFDEHPKWGLTAACIGHSGFPYWRVDLDGRDQVGEVNAEGSRWWRNKGTADVPPGLLLDGPNADVKHHVDDYGPHGYATLDLNDGGWTERIFSAHGLEIHQRRVSPGSAPG